MFYLVYENGEVLGFTDNIETLAVIYHRRSFFLNTKITFRKVKEIPEKYSDTYYEFETGYYIPMNYLELESFEIVMEQSITDLFYRSKSLIKSFDNFSFSMKESSYIKKMLKLAKRPYTIIQNDEYGEDDYYRHCNLIECQIRFFEGFHERKIRRPKDILKSYLRVRNQLIEFDINKEHRKKNKKREPYRKKVKRR